MPAFQEFGAVSERRKADLGGRHRRRLVIGGASASLLLLLVAAVVATVYNTSSASSSSGSSHASQQIHTSSKSVQMLCSSTDYAHACEASLSKAVKSDSSDPKELIKATVSVVVDAVSAAFNHSQLIRSSDPRVRGAVDDCRELFQHSMEELESTLQGIVSHGLERIPERSHDLRTWLSAVMSYQETCVDGFPEGELKDRLKETMRIGKELTSNALAIIGQASKFMAMLGIDSVSIGNQRHLLAAAPEEAVERELVEEGFPSWVPESERRLLRAGKKIKLKLKPNVTVAKDGSEDFTNITAALEAMPKKYQGRYVIHVKKGIYEETVNITKKMVNVTMYGEGSRKTIVTGSKNYVDGTRTFQTATFVASGDGFVAVGMGFRNTAGAIKHQAVALRVQSDRSLFLNCRMEGYQDTLYAQTHRQFYRSCIISGTVDFIFGDAAAVFQNCLLVVRRPLSNQQNIVTANGRLDRHESTGFVLHRCRVLPDLRLKPDIAAFRSYLGRPWKEFSKTIIIESEIGEVIHPDGYMPWEGDFALNTLFYAEFGNAGHGSNVTHRVKWPGFHVISRKEAQFYTAANFIQAGDWVTKYGIPVPVRLGLYNYSNGT